MTVPHVAEALALFVAAGHATDDSGGDAFTCQRCGYVHPVERDVDIPPCDGLPGRARRLRLVARDALREWERAERAARQAEREAGKLADPLGYETHVPIEATARLMAEDATEGRDREAVDEELARWRRGKPAQAPEGLVYAALELLRTVPENTVPAVDAAMQLLSQLDPRR